MQRDDKISGPTINTVYTVGINAKKNMKKKKKSVDSRLRKEVPKIRRKIHATIEVLRYTFFWRKLFVNDVAP